MTEKKAKKTKETKKTIENQTLNEIPESAKEITKDLKAPKWFLELPVSKTKKYFSSVASCFYNADRAENQAEESILRQLDRDNRDRIKFVKKDLKTLVVTEESKKESDGEIQSSSMEKPLFVVFLLGELEFKEAKGE